MLGMGPSKGFVWFVLIEESIEKAWSKQYILIYPSLQSFNLAGVRKLCKSLLGSQLLLALLSKLPRDICICGKDDLQLYI